MISTKSYLSILKQINEVREDMKTLQSILSQAQNKMIIMSDAEYETWISNFDPEQKLKHIELY